MNDSLLIKNNNLVQADSGLWQLPDIDIEQQSFAYSDGDSEESYVLDVISNAKDTCSTSPELEQHIHDWPSEYHLTSKRAHLLRALDLTAFDNVLELGCGCGAITRYLAEQGLNVDAIEGSNRRAYIAQVRCRDFDNINIVNSNFNHLELPERAYDAVFLIGVLEYAKRFCPDAESDRDAVMEILAAAKDALKPGGVIITAIENRLGLKYLMGATEDHYGVPYIGINGYPDSAGICTYDHAEWESILGQADFQYSQFLLPFPDYKIPTVVLHEEFLSHAGAATHLRGATSRDYLRALESDFNEYLFWQASAQNGSLIEFANSYLIVAGDDDDSVSATTPYDFAHFTGSQRKPEYRTMTSKKRDEVLVRKRKLVPGSTAPQQAKFKQNCSDEEYLKGQLLADHWLQSLMTWQDPQRLADLYRDYYEYLKSYQADNPDADDLVDILPFNIVVDQSGQYRSFDREWLTDEPVTTDYVMFRALFWFVYGNSWDFAALFKNNHWDSIRDYIGESMQALGLSVDLDELADREDHLQATIGNDKQQSLVRDLLNSVPQSGSGDTLFYPRLYWALPGKPFMEKNSISATAVMGAGRQTVSFQVPVPLPPGSSVRFDPAERDGYFNLYRVTLRNAGDKELLVLEGAGEIAAQMSSIGITLCQSGARTLFLAQNNDPFFELEIKQGVDGLHIDIEMDWPHSEEYEMARSSLQKEFAEWMEEKARVQGDLKELQRLQQLNQEELQRLQQLNQELQHNRDELELIKGSRSYRAIRKLAGLLGR